MDKGFSTTLKHYNLPREGLIEIFFENDSDYCLFHYTSVSSTKLGSSMAIEIDSPILELIREKEKMWKFKGVKHNPPSGQNPRDFYWMRFEISLSYLDLVEVLEKLRTEDKELQSSTPNAKKEVTE